MNWRKLIPLLVIVAGLLAYSNSFTGPFIFDDVGSIPENPTIRRLWPIWEPLSPPHRGGLTVEGRPIINLSLALSYALSGDQVWGYHAVNLAVHILAGLTLFGIVRRTVRRREGWPRRSAALPTADAGGGTRSAASGAIGRDAVPHMAATPREATLPRPTRLTWQRGPTNDVAAALVALAVAVIWTVHPLQTESVTYIIQRAESIMGLFYLLTLYCFIRGTESDRPSAWYSLSVAACAFGMASKEVMVSAPLMVFLYDRTFITGSFRQAWQRRRSLYLGLAATWVVLASLMSFNHSLGNALTNSKVFGVDRWGYLLTEPGVILHYLRVTLWPNPLCFDYFGWPVARTLSSILATALALAILLGTIVWGCKTNSAWWFLGAWLFLILAPSSSFIPLDSPAFEHRMYLASASVVTLAVWGLYWWMGERSVAVFAVVAIGLGLLTWQRNQDYRSELAIWQDTVVKRPSNPRAHNNLGLALLRAGQPVDAIWQCEQALAIVPEYADAHNNLGLALSRVGKLQQAVGEFEWALRAKPDFAAAHYNLGVALLQLGRMQEAINHLEAALRILPDLPGAHNNLGVALLKTGKLEPALEHLEQAVRIKPDYAAAHYNLGVALEQAGRKKEALRQYEEVVRIDPNYVDARKKIAGMEK